MTSRTNIGFHAPIFRVGTAALLREFKSPRYECYLDTASYGLPPLATIAALEQALRGWSDGNVDWQCEWDAIGEECRQLAAPMLGAPSNEIALLPAVSVGVGLISANLTSEDRVVVADDEFRSVLWPLLAASHARGTHIRRVSFKEVAEAITPGDDFGGDEPCAVERGRFAGRRVTAEAVAGWAQTSFSMPHIRQEYSMSPPSDWA
jgi:kynureninase